jgi:hypothetical protein
MADGEGALKPTFPSVPITPMSLGLCSSIKVYLLKSCSLHVLIFRAKHESHLQSKDHAEEKNDERCEAGKAAHTSINPNETANPMLVIIHYK